MNLFEPPPGYHRIKRVDSFDELVSTRFADDINALCWPRALPGDFGEVVEQLGPGSGIETIDDTRLRRLSVSAAGRAAIERLLAYFSASTRTHLRLAPEDIDESEVGHFAFFRSQYQEKLWPIALHWLEKGELRAGTPGKIGIAAAHGG